MFSLFFIEYLGIPTYECVFCASRDSARLANSLAAKFSQILTLEAPPSPRTSNNHFSPISTHSLSVNHELARKFHKMENSPWDEGDHEMAEASADQNEVGVLYISFSVAKD